VVASTSLVAASGVGGSGGASGGSGGPGATEEREGSGALGKKASMRGWRTSTRTFRGIAGNSGGWEGLSLCSSL
jgi:hypothetical protein